MLNTIQGLDNQGYGMLYVIPATYMYILATNTAVSVPVFGLINPDIGIGLLLLFSLYAVIWFHHVGLLIFGNDAGLASPRESESASKHLVYFATGVKPQKLPNTASYVSLSKAAFSSEDFRWQAFLRFLPLGFYNLYAFTAWLLLSLIFINGDASLIPGAFWLILSVLIFRNRIVGYLPDYIPTESVDGLQEPEYMRSYRRLSEETHETNSRPRIRK